MSKSSTLRQQPPRRRRQGLPRVLGVLALLGVASGVATPRARGRGLLRRPLTRLHVSAPMRPTEESSAAIRGASASERFVDVDLGEEGRFRFHAMWLRDACRDEACVAASAGERRLTATPVMTPDPATVAAADAKLEDGGETLRVTWAAPPQEDEIKESVFSASFLRRYVRLVAKPLDDAKKPAAAAAAAAAADLAWLRPYTGYPEAKAPKPEELRLWRGEEVNAGSYSLPRMTHAEALADPLKLMRGVMEHAIVIIDDVPESADASTLHSFVADALGGLQKDPARDEVNWKITKRVGATSISYDHDKRLNNHTDSSIPPHGIPAVLLIMHYLAGKGHNTLVDGFAVAKQLREEDPEAFELLATYGYDGERDFIASRGDSGQKLSDGSLLVTRRHPIFDLDADGELRRITYNEVFRMPLTLPFDEFEGYFNALNKFVKMLHAPEFEVDVPMQAGRMLVMQNWRLLHGRAGGKASTSRTVVGGTVLREAFFSKATQLLGARGEDLHGVFSAEEE